MRKMEGGGDNWKPEVLFEGNKGEEREVWRCFSEAKGKQKELEVFPYGPLPKINLESVTGGDGGTEIVCI